MKSIWNFQFLIKDIIHNLSYVRFVSQNHQHQSNKLKKKDFLFLNYYFSFLAKLLKVKAAVWALGHAGTSPIGIEHLNHLGIVELLACMAESCSYYSIRATAMYAVSLIGTTRVGADLLSSYDWPCVRYGRGKSGLVITPSEPHSSPSPVPIRRHHRSLSDGKPDYSETIVPHRTRIRSESAATDLEARRYLSPERADTPSPVSSINKLSQQDAEGYQKLRSLHFYRRPSYSHSSLEVFII